MEKRHAAQRRPSQHGPQARPETFFSCASAAEAAGLADLWIQAELRRAGATGLVAVTRHDDADDFRRPVDFIGGYVLPAL